MFQFLTAQLSDIVLYALTTIFAVVGNLTAIAAKALNLAIFVRPGGNLLIVETTWTILRDFSNMIFIVLLIYMAFATIFDHGKYTFKDMIVRFLIVAVLINFSLVIGNLIIDACQVLTNIFLGSIGNVGDRLGQYLNPSLLLPNAADLAKLKGADITLAVLTSVVFAIVLSLIFLFSLLVAMVFAIIRTPIIWALLIVSPLAWMSHVLPSSEGWWKKWWSQFFGWNLFLPVYLFFMYLGLLFLSKRNEIIGAVITANTATGNPATDPLLASITNSLSFNLTFFYLFAAFVMVGGTWAATKVTSMMGSGFDKGLGWARATVGRLTKYDSTKEALQGAYKQRKEQFQQEGFQNRFLNKLYGGKEADQRKQAGYAQKFGVRNAAENQKSKDVGLWKEKIKNLSPAEWRNMMTNTKLPTYQRIAAAELLRDISQLSSDELIATYKLSGGDHSAMARKFLTDVDFSKLSKEERGAVLNDKDIKDIRVRQKLATIMAEKGDINESGDLVALAKELYGPNNELGWREFLGNAKKKKLIIYAEAMAKMNLTPQEVQQELDGSDSKGPDGKSIPLFNPDGTKKLKSVERFVAEQISKMKIEEIGEQDLDIWKDNKDGEQGRLNKAFRDALIIRLNKAQKADPRRRSKKNGNIIPGGGEKLIRDLKNKVKEDGGKVTAIRKLESMIELGDEIEIEDEIVEGEEGTPPTSSGTGTVSYHETGVNTANVIDLRNNRDIEIK